MDKIACIGDKDSVLAFNALGLTVFATSDPKEATKKLAVFAKDSYAIIFITEQLAAQMEQAIASYIQKTTPAIILIPNNSGSNGLALSNLRVCVERAVGTDIFKN